GCKLSVYMQTCASATRQGEPDRVADAASARRASPAVSRPVCEERRCVAPHRRQVSRSVFDVATDAGVLYPWRSGTAPKSDRSQYAVSLVRHGEREGRQILRRLWYDPRHHNVRRMPSRNLSCSQVL